MRHIYSTLWLIGLLCLSPLLCDAQIVTTSPAIVQRSSSPIVITFHADQGNKGLMGLSSTQSVYAHTGIIVKGSSEWQKAPQWLDNSAKYKLTYVSPNTWQLTLPSINEYYGVTDAVQVEKLAFVFRNANGTKEGKTASGGDIFVDVAANGFEMSFSSSHQSSVVTDNTPISFTVNTTVSADISIYINTLDSSPIASQSDVTALSTEYTITSTGVTSVIARAESAGEVRTDTLKFIYTGAPVAEDYPGGTPRMGAVANADGSVTFCIAAPGKTSAMLIGSWTGYEPDIDGVMKYQDYEGNRYFWTTISGLKQATDYPYYYLIDGTTSVGDPYARLVLDPWNDRDISAEVFPNLPKYPSDKVTGVPLAVYNSASDEYKWKIKDFKGVDQSSLVIYELLIRDFTGTEGKAEGSGTIAGVMSKLDYLKELGVNAVELLPIMEFNGNNSWGYNTNFYFAPDKAYGTPDDYRALIDAIHERGMAVILDIVFNQSDGLHPWYQMYPIAQNPFYNGTAPHSYSVLNDWNQDNPLVQQQFKDALKYWLSAYNVDGFRFDLVKGLGSNQSYNATYDAATNQWSGVTDAKTNAYNASRVARMKELHDAMRDVNPDAYFINENLAGAKEENEMAQDGEINWANINHASCQFAMGYADQSDLNRFYAVRDSRTWGSTVSYAESHDEERMAYKIAQYGATGVKGNTALSMRRLGSVAAQMLMTPGAHMIWQFQEFGADQTTKNSSGNDTSPKKVIWSYLDDPDHRGLMESYTELCAIRNLNPALFKEAGVTTDMQCGTANWTQGRLISLVSDNAQLYCVVNPNTTGRLSYTIPFKNDATTYKLLSASYGVTPELAGNVVTLPPGAYAVYGSSTLSGIDNPAVDDADHGSVRVVGSENSIMIIGDYEQAFVYGIDGRRIASSHAQPVIELIDAGLYIVVVDGRSHKVAVK